MHEARSQSSVEASPKEVYPPPFTLPHPNSIINISTNATAMFESILDSIHLSQKQFEHHAQHSPADVPSRPRMNSAEVKKRFKELGQLPPNTIMFPTQITAVPSHNHAHRGIKGHEQSKNSLNKNDFHPFLKVNSYFSSNDKKKFELDWGSLKQDSLLNREVTRKNESFPKSHLKNYLPGDKSSGPKQRVYQKHKASSSLGKVDGMMSWSLPRKKCRKTEGQRCTSGPTRSVSPRVNRYSKSTNKRTRINEPNSKVTFPHPQRKMPLSTNRFHKNPNPKNISQDPTLKNSNKDHPLKPISKLEKNTTPRKNPSQPFEGHQASNSRSPNEFGRAKNFHGLRTDKFGDHHFDLQTSGAAAAPKLRSRVPEPHQPPYSRSSNSGIGNPARTVSAYQYPTISFNTDLLLTLGVVGITVLYVLFVVAINSG